MNFVSVDTYDHAVCFNFPDYELKTPPENNIALILEPPELVDSMMRKQKSKTYKNVREIFSFAADNYEPVFGMGFATVPEDNYPSLLDKPNNICMITSNKLMTPYHKKRQDIKNALLKTDLPIDFYGRGMRDGDDPRIKGEIPPMDKQSILRHYAMCIDFENSPHCVVTDKFFDPVLCNTMPISNSAILHTLVDQDSFFFVSFDMSINDIVSTIEEIVGFAPDEGNEEALLNAKYEIRSGGMCLAEWIFRTIRKPK